MRVARDLVSLAHDPPDDRRVPFRDPTQHEEGRSGPSGREDVQEFVNVRFEPGLEPVPIVGGEARPDVLGVEPILDIEGRHESLLLGRGNGNVSQLHFHATPFLSVFKDVGPAARSAGSVDEPPPGATPFARSPADGVRHLHRVRDAAPPATDLGCGDRARATTRASLACGCGSGLERPRGVVVNQPAVAERARTWQVHS